MQSSRTAEAIAERVARLSYGKLVAFLAARNRDVASAEDALAEAFAAALQDWPRTGPPDNPEAWLLTVARRKQVDWARRRQSHDLAAPHLLLLAEDYMTAEGDSSAIPDRRLGLMFACAHPAIDLGVRTPLILQTVLGFDAATIASAFLVSPAAMGQRLVRAKTKIREAGIPLQVPEPEDLPERLDAVLDAIYACFAEGWSDPAGAEARRRDLSDEAIWLGRLVAGLLPDEPAALGLLALMLHAEARRGARRGPGGEFVPLSEQSPALWDPTLIAEAEHLIVRASRSDRLGRFQLLAAIQSAHAARRITGQTDWPAIVWLYDVLLDVTGSPVVAINRAVAIAEARGPEAGLAALAEIEADAAITQYQPYWAAKAGLLTRCGDVASANEAYGLAIGLEADPAVRDFLSRRRQALRN
jgi:RNA polymerase sigma-70 factor (ECF subfamily)